MRFHHRIGIESVSLKAELFLLFLEETIIGFLISFVISAVSSAARYGDIVFAAAILFFTSAATVYTIYEINNGLTMNIIKPLNF